MIVHHIARWPIKNNNPLNEVLTMSTTYQINHPEKGLIQYTDQKRYLWMASILLPLLAVSGVAGYFWLTSEWALLAPLVFLYGVVPALDNLFGSDENNPPEELVPQLEEDRYYRILTWLTVPMHFIVLFAMAWFVGTTELSLWAMVAVALTAGIYSGLGINTAHELGHKKPLLERRLARLALAVSTYGHFCVEHNRGHHRDVATGEDPASSRMGESIYKFMLREIPGAFRRGWEEEQQRLQRKGKSVWSLENEILQSYALSAVIQVGLIATFGWVMVPFLLIHNFWAWFQLTSANYIEHYGLLRERKENGRYEHCQPHHSWNANYIFSNILLFHLERHSDHHANPTRRYQSLRNFDNIPELPNGYFGMFLVAYIPWLWYRVMDKRLLALPHIQGDLSKVNIDPAKRDAILAHYGKQAV
ncbi:alkane 1-monooxygenase [Isoalcanivorax pacificus W11-5]|jgi:alkane 1-monooxygenase|uniref:Alkane 1-monooxygenase n=1 Tax=Isoalcanivorax pacificus W11-5 TaxID=391936 RepID=A0A0B4XPK1_9GAMM|nr:alkane 1-monooxygenase [Isoalcanivorax pacificus]AJD48670.1 alkane 1-monooxygenase [Isoalcanivorax pacificus W11-5]